MGDFNGGLHANAKLNSRERHNDSIKIYIDVFGKITLV